MSACGERGESGMVMLQSRTEGAGGGADSGDLGRGGPGRTGAPLRGGPRRRDADSLPAGAAGGRGADGGRGRRAGPAQRGHGPAGAAPLSGRRPGRGAAAAPAGAAAAGAGHLAGGVGAGGRFGPAGGGGSERGLDDPPAGRLPGRGDGASGSDRHGAGLAASAGVRLQAARLDAQAQGPGAAGVGKKRVRVEALLAAAASPLPPPLAELMPDPTLLRGWSRKGRRGQRLVEAPGDNEKRYGFGLVDWREGWFDWEVAEGRRAAPFCAQLRRAVDRSTGRGRIAMVILDNLGIHTPRGSRLLRALLEELGDRLVLVYTPTYDPDANRIEWLWRLLRRAVTHTHRRETLDPLLTDADEWARDLPPAQVLRQIGSPFALEDESAQELNHAA